MLAGYQEPPGRIAVYLAQDTKLDRKVALKTLLADLAVNRDRMQRFAREVKSAAALNHPNIAHIYDANQEYFKDGVRLLELSKKAYSLIKKQKPHERRKLL